MKVKVELNLIPILKSDHGTGKEDIESRREISKETPTGDVNTFEK